MLKQSTRNKLLLLVLITIPAVGIIPRLLDPQFQVSLLSLSQSHLEFVVLSLFLLKTAAILYPPVPGSIITIAAIPFIGWPHAYMVEITGSLTGSSLAYLAGKYKGKQFIIWLIGKKTADKLFKLKLKQKNQFEAAIILRLASGGMLSDGLAWGASLLGFRYLPFILGYCISHLLSTLPIFILVGFSISLKSWVVVVPVAIIAWLLLLKFKGKYFE